MQSADAPAAGYRLRSKERSLERLGCANVGLRRALAHGNADAGAGEVNPAAGDERALLEQLIGEIGRPDDEIAGDTRTYLRNKLRPGDEGDADLVAARAFEYRDDLVQRLFERGRAVDHDFSGACLTAQLGPPDHQAKAAGGHCTQSHNGSMGDHDVLLDVGLLSHCFEPKTTVSQSSLVVDDR